MNQLRPLASAAAVLLLLAGCGDAASSESDKAPANLVVDQSGATPDKTVWYVRIENLKAEKLAEQGFPGKRISLRRHLEPGKYRVISWYRPCEQACPDSGERGLGPLAQVCGAKVTVAKGQRTKATVKVGTDGCTISVV